MLAVEDVQLFGDGGGGDDVVAGEHLDLDARRLAGVHGVVHFGAQRVGDADEAVEGHVRLRLAARGGAHGGALVREGEHAAGALLQLHDALFRRLLFRFRQIAQAEDLFGAALGEHGVALPFAHHRGHVFEVGREGVQVGNFRLLAQFFIVGAAAAGGDEQRPLGGVAHKADGAPFFI